MPIFITILYFLYTSYRLPNILKLPSDPKEYKKVKNIFKIIVTILLVIIRSILLGETTKTYINMAGYYLKHIINENHEIYYSTIFNIILLAPISFIAILYFIVLRKIFFGLGYIIVDIFRVNSINKYANILALCLIFITEFIIFYVLGLFAFKMATKYINLISSII